MKTQSKKKLLCIIPARGGSKRIPDKNIRKLLGRPLIAYAIDAACKARSVDRVIVSTDSDKIAKIAEKHGADVPFLRPKRLAGDATPTLPVIRHALQYLKKEGETYDAVLCLQATSPLVTPADVDGAWKIFVEKKARSVVSVCRVDAHPEWFFSLTPSGRMKPLISDPRARMKRSQNLPAYYTLSGAIFIMRTADVLSGVRPPYDRAYVMPPERSIDIDDMEDFKKAGLRLEAWGLGLGVPDSGPQASSLIRYPLP
jgi:CMP-N-acetylneuraminic acid synthetase